MQIPRKLKLAAYTVGGIVVVLVALAYFGFVLPFWGMPFNGQRHGHPPITPPWALECWLWEDDVNTAAFVNELLEGYAANDIPVRTILIDSPWSTRYNDFSVDETRYPKPAEFFGNLQNKGYRVVLWMTCNVNSHSKDTAIADSQDWYDQARRKGYLTGTKAMRWWKGTGGFIDYSNPAATEWWHGMQQSLFDWGIDGWKLDGADTLFYSKLGPLPLPFQRSYSGLMTTRRYMDLYARSEYQHGLDKNPDFITLIRAYDTPWAHPEGFAPIDAAPVTWIGDRHHAWAAGGSGESTPDKDLMRKDADEGLEAALRDILLSSRKGYCVVGDDIGGYHGTPEIPPRLYMRWAEFGAFTGLFLNGGHGERRLWKRTQEELEVIRKFSWLHTELVPYMYDAVVRCHEGGPSLIQPVDGKYHYLFGRELLVAPIYQDSPTNSVALPPGGWRYLFDDKELLQGPKTFSRDFPMDQYPVYVRDGAIIPMNVSRDYTGFGSRQSEGAITWNIYPAGQATARYCNTDNTWTSVSVDDQQGKLVVDVRESPKSHILSIRLDAKPSAVSCDGATLDDSKHWTYDAARRRLSIRGPMPSSSRYEVLK